MERALFSHNKPIVRDVKKLSALGRINLDYVDFLCDALRMGDCLQLMRPKPKADKKYQMLGQVLKNQSDYLIGIIRRFGALTVAFTARRINELNFANKAPVISLSRKEVEGIISKAGSLLAGLMAENNNELARAEAAQWLTSSDRLKAQVVDFPLGRLLMEYNKPSPHRRGNKANPWGTLFLLAVTEHIRAKTRKPHYAEASQLLGKVRLEYQKEYHRRLGRFPKTNAQSATVRIKTFKKDNPTWEDALSVFNEQFRLSSKRKNQG